METIASAQVTHTLPACMALGIFIVAYGLVIAEEFLDLRKSKPVVLASGLMWLLVAWIALEHNASTALNHAMQSTLFEYTALLLFILVAMLYIHAMENRGVFDALRAFLIRKGFSYRQLFWMTGILGFFLSAIADNLATVLALSTLLLVLGRENPRFINLACVNLVVAANAGGVFTPFGDITTLMVWQAGILPIKTFFRLFFPAILNFGIPAICLYFAVPKGHPSPLQKSSPLTRSGMCVVVLFLLTLVTTVLAHHFLHVPPVIGMMLGLGYLQFFAYYTQRRQMLEPLDIFSIFKSIEWDTLLFFYGIMLCVGALGTLGYLSDVSHVLYETLGRSFPPAHQASAANILVGILSALVDNIPVMFSVIKMKPSMSEGQWLLVTLTTGVGGSLLSVGSAAGIALMGQTRHYTFLSHLKWFIPIAVGYFGSIMCHMVYNAAFF